MKKSTRSSYFRFCLLFAVILVTGGFARAQVVVNEAFDTYNNSLPLGWNWATVTGFSENQNRWTDRNNTIPVTPSPNPAAHSGANFAFYNSTGALAGDQAVMVTKSFDLSARGASPASVRFWMYRDNISSLADSVTIYVGNSSSLASATRLGVLQRYYNVAPFAGANTWNQYTYALPAGINTSHTYVFFLGTSRTGYAILIDDFSIDTWPSAMTFNSTNMWYQGVQTVSKASVNESVIGICIITDNAATPRNLYRITFNANGSTNPLNDIQNAKLWYTGQSKEFKIMTPSSNQIGATITPVTTGSKIAFMNAGGVPPPLMTLTNDTNYFWLTYDVKATATANNLLDAEFDSVVVGTAWAGATYAAPATSTLPGTVQIDPYCIPSSSNACYGCYVQGVFLNGANGTKISTGSSSVALPANTGAMNSGTHYCFAPCISPPLGTTLRYKLFPPIPNQTVTLNVGNSYTLKLQYGIVTGNIGAFIDYNNDYDFDDTLVFGGIQYYERLGYKSSLGTSILGCSGGGCTVTGTQFPNQNVLINFTVPPAGTPGLVYGNHRLRIREVSLFTGTYTVCSNYGHGECEDYIISITPACTAGLCQWLGYTDDWNTPSNWCPGVPTLGDIARIDYSYSFTPLAGYHKPVIRSGVDARCRTLRISNTDTVFVYNTKYDEINGVGLTTPASLTIADSMRINYNTASGNGALKVITNQADSAQMSNGTFGAAALSPFQTYRRNRRMQTIITKSELQAKGMIEGDIIDSLVFYIRALSSASADSFGNFTIRVANLTTPGWSFPAAPVSWAPTGAFTTVFGPTTLNVRAVQATHPNAVPSVTAANQGQLSLICIPNSFVWNGVDDIVLDFCFSNPLVGGLPANLVQLSQTQTTGSRRVCFANNSSSAGGAGLCLVNFPLPGGFGTVAASSDYRPNVTFKFRRPLSKTLITMTGDSAGAVGYWENNGSFTAGWSEVKFEGTGLQTIGGSNVTTYSDLRIVQNAGSVNMLRDVNVDSTLTLNSGELTINRNLLTINKPGPGSVVRTAGWIKSEDTPPGNYSRMAWNMASTAGNYIFPFGMNSTTYLPFGFNHAGTAGLVTVATYRSAVDNTPYPVSSGPFTINVLHMNGQATGNNISITDVVDRFWQINRTGSVTNATLSFSYKTTSAPAGEEPAAGPFTYVAQRFQLPGGTGSPLGGWANRGGTNTPGNVSATLVGDPINGPWTLGNFANPLPIELISFDATLIGDKVKTYWATASEIDNDHFMVERTTDMKDFDFIAFVKSKGSSTVTQNYEAWDLNPLPGLQYYRLKTIGTNGDVALSPPVPVRISSFSGLDINFIYSNSENRNLLVNFSYTSELPYSVRLTDVFGRTLYYKENCKGLNGENALNLDQVLQVKGAYFIAIENSTQRVVKSFIY